MCGSNRQKICEDYDLRYTAWKSKKCVRKANISNQDRRVFPKNHSQKVTD